MTARRTKAQYINLVLMLDRRWTPASNLKNAGRAVLAILWTALWGLGRFLYYTAAHNYYRAHWPIRRLWHLAYTWGRHESPKAVLCSQCSWAGPFRWAIHDYEGDGMGDVEGIDECPRCCSQALEPILRRRNGSWGS